MDQTELDIQRYTQLRNEIKEAIETIPPSLEHLDKTSKLLASHFDVFRELVKNTREQIPSLLKSASQDLAQASAYQLSQLLDNMFKDKIILLKKSIEDASEVLDQTMGDRYRKLIFFTTLGCILCGAAGFGIGYFYSTFTGYLLPPDFGKAYEIGRLHKTLFLLEEKVDTGKRKAIKK